MNHDETEALLIRASVIDSRKITPSMVDVWQEILANVDFTAAKAALVAHRREHPGVYLEPGHIRQQVIVALDRERARRGPHPRPPAGELWAADIIGAREVEA